ncbi:MAG: ABC transporter ATP-binding protein, partial [Acidimicrobiales bacterium]
PALIPASADHHFACWHPVDGPLALSVSVPASVPASGAEARAATLPAVPVSLSRHEPVIVEPAPNGSVPAPNGSVPAATGAGSQADRPGLLELDHVVREYPVTAGLLQRQVAAVKAVSDISFTVVAGETFGLVGESGCGKTTLGKVIVGLERPDSGAVSLGGTNVAALSGGGLRRFRRDLQMMFQDPIASLDPRMRVGAALREPMRIQHVGTHRQQTELISSLLEEVGLPANTVERFPHEFSGGQRQRIGLARALTLNPRVIVADEPVSALDVSIRSQVLNLMMKLQKDHGTTYIVISHDLAVVKYMSDRIGVMYLGKLVEMGSGDDIYHRPAHHYTAGLIAAVPEPDPTIHAAGKGTMTGELPSPISPPSGCRFRTRCPAAQQRCADEEPQLRLFHDGHVAACHFPLQQPIGDVVAVSAVATSEGAGERT